MDLNAFQNIADQTLETLFDALDEQVGDVVEVDFDNDVLTLVRVDGRQYIINKHAPNQEIWLSSPVSGAAHFSYDEASKRWASTRSNATLHVLLGAEMSTLTQKTVSLESA